MKALAYYNEFDPEAAANIKAKAAQLGISESALVDRWAKRLKT